MFTVKSYDLGDEVERVGYYQDVVEEMQVKKAIITSTNKYKRKTELTREQKDKRNKERSIQRTKTKIRRLTQRYNMRYMWTLTFSKKYITIQNKNGTAKTYDTGNYDDAWHLWKMFLKRCKRQGLEFDYIATIEVQEKRLEKYGEKVYHFHFITNKNIPVNAKQASRRGLKYNMSSLWGNGYTFVTHKKSKKKLAHLYIVKYIAKLVEEMGTSKQRYRVKQGLEIPLEVLEMADHVEFFVSAGEGVKKSSYNVLGDKLEIFWMIYKKGET